ncbi:hypothetical protein [Novosphingobium sp. MMS21-SN21R]|uniref:hypothetical protein n=1 Tax=Novosphingobium sp. MMS21-SN21R TaxID=2969298 RepID=UPI002886C089|nr:hypothetical protein [Novosphingobium sp. MMS21-SN21R]MDT0506925.1 hypothetical protein [Novosphingobium sp. MMS21-SN21R]
MTDAAPRNKIRLRYAPKSAISRAVEAVRANGIDVVSVTMGGDGSIKLSATDDKMQLRETLFDTLDREGRL